MHPNNSQTVPVVTHVHISEVDSAPRESQMDVCSSHLRTAPTLRGSIYTKPQMCKKIFNSSAFPSIPCGQVSNIYCSWKGIQSVVPYLKDYVYNICNYIYNSKPIQSSPVSYRSQKYWKIYNKDLKKIVRGSNILPQKPNL